MLRPNLPPVDLGMNQYLKQRHTLSLQEMDLRSYREYLQRHLPSNSFTQAMLEPLRLPHQRKKLWEGKNRRQKRDYIEDLTKFNQSGAPENTGKIRVDKQLLRYAKKLKQENPQQLPP